MNKINKQSGYIVLIGVMFIGAIGTLIAISLLVSSQFSAKNSLTLLDSHRSTSYRDACEEVALDNLRRDPLYLGESISFDEGRCEVFVALLAETSYIIESEGESGEGHAKSRMTATLVVDLVDSNNNTISIDSYESLADF